MKVSVKGLVALVKLPKLGRTFGFSASRLPLGNTNVQQKGGWAGSIGVNTLGLCRGFFGRCSATIGFGVAMIFGLVVVNVFSGRELILDV